MISNGTLNAYSLTILWARRGGCGVEFYGLGVRQSKEVRVDTVISVCGLFQGPLGLDMIFNSLTTSWAFVCFAHHRVIAGHIHKDRVKMPETNMVW